MCVDVTTVLWIAYMNKKFEKNIGVQICNNNKNRNNLPKKTFELKF
jgi:hypothetical protein